MKHVLPCLWPYFPLQPSVDERGVRRIHSSKLKYSIVGEFEDCLFLRKEVCQSLIYCCIFRTLPNHTLNVRLVGKIPPEYHGRLLEHKKQFFCCIKKQQFIKQLIESEIPNLPVFITCILIS